MAFTIKQIEALKPGQNRYEITEDGGLSLRVSPKGKKTFCYVYRQEGKLKRLTLGTFPEISLSQARQKLAEAKTSRANGEDPIEAKKWAEEKRKSMPTVSKFADEYIKRWAKPNKKSWEEDQRYLEKDIKPLIGNKKMNEVKRRDIIFLLDKIHDRGASVAANRAFACISRMFNFALERGVLDMSPVTKIKTTPEDSRKRVLTRPEIKTLFYLLNEQRLWIGTRLVLEMTLRTAQRPGEVRQMTGEEIDSKAQIWTIPGTRTKNGETQVVPLTEKMVNLIDFASSLSNTKWIFPSPKIYGPVSSYGLAQGIRRALNKSDLPSTTPHDLRRTAATIISELGFNRLVVDKLLNHKDRTVGGIYDRHTYEKEKREALEAWESELEEILSGKVDKDGKVIDIRKAQG